MTPILQSCTPYDLSQAGLPGIAPLAIEDWILRDDSYDAQMALRDDLIATRRSEVNALQAGAEDAAQEVMQLILTRLRSDDGYDVGASHVRRPDGVVIDLADDPLCVAGRLVQQDLCILQKPEGQGEHVLTGAILCFPAGWMLREKMGKPLIRIHKPVSSYDPDLARRVQRLFDGVRVGRPLWRCNALGYVDPSLFQPRSEGEPKYGAKTDQRYIRSERQVILRLPESGAVVFGIHTFVLAAKN